MEDPPQWERIGELNASSPRRPPRIHPDILRVAVPFACLLALMGVYNIGVSGRLMGGSPKRVTYCGREYAGGGTGTTFAQVRTFYNKLDPSGTATFHMVQVGTFPWILGDGLYLASFDAGRPHAPGEVCAMAVWLKLGPDSYAGYSLEGGP